MKWLTETLLPKIENDFQLLENQINFINRIDQYILESKLDSNLDKILNNLFKDFIKIVKAQKFIVAYFSYKKLCAIYPEKEINDDKITNFANSCYELLSLGKLQLNKELKCVALPILVHGKLFNSVFVFWEIESNQFEFTNSSEFKEFVNPVKEQLSILVEKFLTQHRNQIQTNLLETFFNKKLNPKDCWDNIVDGINNFLPNFAYSKIRPHPKIQLLFYTEKDKYLTIVSTQGEEPASTKVLVDESICGLLILNREKKYIYIDPMDEEYRPLYKGFLIKTRNKIARSELAIAIKDDSKIVGILNLEHYKKEVFKEFHVETFLEVVKFLVPLISALKDRHEGNRIKEIRLVYVLTNLLNRIGSTYQHDLGHPITKAFLTIESLETSLNTLHCSNEKINENIDRIKKYLDEISMSTDRFAENLPEFISFGSKSIIGIINDAINLCDPTNKLLKSENIGIELHCSKDDYFVFSSKILREHIYNLLDNSLFSIRRKMSLQQLRKGIIKITISRYEVKVDNADSSETAFIRIEIKDNGEGVPKNLEENIGKPHFSTKDALGTGNGFASARDYIESIDGKFEHKNFPGEGFIVILHLHEFNPKIHRDKIKDQ